MAGHQLRHYRLEPHDVQIAKLEVDTKVLDELLKDNRRINALRTIIDDLRYHRTHLREGDDPAAEERIGLSRITGILADNWDG